MSKTFRIQLVLMIFGRYSFGDHVVDQRAFGLRLDSLMR